MAHKYKYNGVLGNSFRQREWREWIIVSTDGEEFRFKRKDHAVLAIKAMFEVGHRAKLYEETIIRTIKEWKAIDEKFRIDITESVELEMKLKHLVNMQI